MTTSAKASHASSLSQRARPSRQKNENDRGGSCWPAVCPSLLYVLLLIELSTQHGTGQSFEPKDEAAEALEGDHSDSRATVRNQTTNDKVRPQPRIPQQNNTKPLRAQHNYPPRHSPLHPGAECDLRAGHQDHIQDGSVHVARSWTGLAPLGGGIHACHILVKLHSRSRPERYHPSGSMGGKETGCFSLADMACAHISKVNKLRSSVECWDGRLAKPRSTDFEDIESRQLVTSKDVQSVEDEGPIDLVTIESGGM